MGAAKQVAALVAALFVSAPALAEPYGEITAPMTKFYVSIPLGASGSKQTAFTYGMQLQGSRPYEVINLGSRPAGC